MLRKALYLGVSLTAISGAAFADTVSVTNNNDTGPGSFRQAVMDANDDSAIDTISFDSDFYIELQSEVEYNGEQNLEIQGSGATLSGGSVGVDTDTWDSGLFVATGGASLWIEDLDFQKSFNNGLAVFLPEDASSDVLVLLDNVSVSQSQFFGVIVDGQSTTGFNTDDIIHHNCSDPWPYNFGANITMVVLDSEIVQNGRLDDGYDISLATGCPQDFDGLRVDQGDNESFDGNLEAYLVYSHFDHNLADGAELDEKGDGSVYAQVMGSTFNHNGDTVEILCTAEAVAIQEDMGDEDTCEEGDLIQDLDDGFDIDEEDGGHMAAMVADTDVVGNNDEGLDFDEAGDGDIYVEVDNVKGIRNEDEALKASEEDDGDVMVLIVDSTFKQGGDDGTQLEEEGDGSIDVDVFDSRITHNAKTGIKVEQADASLPGSLDIVNTDLRRNDERIETDGGVVVTEN